MHFSAAAIGGGYARSWVLLLLLGAATEGASAGADCGCYWKKLWQTIAKLHRFFVYWFWFRTFTRFVCAARSGLALSSFIWFFFFFTRTLDACPTIDCVMFEGLTDCRYYYYISHCLGAGVYWTRGSFFLFQTESIFWLCTKILSLKQFCLPTQAYWCQGCSSSLGIRSHERTAVPVARVYGG